MNETLKFRHEWKHEISYLDINRLRLFSFQIYALLITQTADLTFL